jgi:hypothetical protein
METITIVDGITDNWIQLSGKFHIQIFMKIRFFFVSCSNVSIRTINT